MKLMKGIVVTEKNVVKVADDIPVPELGPYDCLCRVHACGFCTGTDFGIIHGLTTAAQGFRGYPTVLGHEGAGEVVEVGEKVRHIKVGDRFIHPNLRPDVGNGYTKTYGGMAQFGLVCDQQAMVEDGVCKPEEVPFYKKQGRFSDKIDFVDAALLLSLCECHSAAKNFGVKPGDSVLFYGAGPMGTALALFMKLRGAAKVTVIDGVAERLENSVRVAGTDRTINFSTVSVAEVIGSERFDLVVDAVGSSSVVLEGSGYLKQGGTLCGLGVLKSGDTLLDASRLQNNTRLHMLNFPYGEYDILPETVEMIEQGKVHPRDFYSHVVPFTEIDRAMHLLETREAFKVVLDFDA